VSISTKPGSSSGGSHFRLERRLVFESRLAQARGQVDEAGDRGEAARIDRLVDLESVGSIVQRGDLALRDEDRSFLVPFRGGIEHARAADLDPHGDPSMLITAMRTAMP
jgi:hypothetical protein